MTSDPRKLSIGMLQAEPHGVILPAEVAAFQVANIDLLILPEYFWLETEDETHRDALDHFESSREKLAELSQILDCTVVGGTMVEPTAEEGDANWHNTSFVFQKGRQLGFYRKQRLMPGEAKGGAVPGNEILVIEVEEIRVAPVICADVFDPDIFHALAEAEVDLITAPVASPYLPEDTIESKLQRDREIFVDRSQRAKAPIVKVCTVGAILGKRPLQGRSLIVTPEGVQFRTPFEEEQERRSWIHAVELKS